MEILKLKARLRAGTGKSHNRKTRAAHWIPAVFYGRGQKTENIEIDSAEFLALARAKKTTHLFDLGLPDHSESVAVIKEMQRDVLKDSLYYHIDFQHVSMTEKISVACPVVVVGLPIGVKEDGGVLENPSKTLNIECLPMDIPEKITVDVSDLRINQSIHVKDIHVDKVVITDSPEEVVALVTRVKEEVVAAPAPVEGEVPAEGAPVPEGEAVAGAGEAKDVEEPKKEEKTREKKEEKSREKKEK